MVLGPFASFHRSSQVPQSGVGSPVLQGIELSLANSNLNCNPMQFRAWLVAAAGSASSSTDSDLLAPPTLLSNADSDSALAGVSQAGPPGTPLGLQLVQPSGSVPAPVVGASLSNPEALFGCNNITVQVRKDNSPAEVYVVVVNSTDHVVLETVYDVQAPVMTKSVM